MKEKVILKTIDNKEIVGNYIEVSGAKGAGLLLHMMPSTKESWNGFAKELLEAGFSSLAIDLRGHGESDGGPEGFMRFDDKEHQKSMLDVKASIEFLKNKGVAIGKIFLAGASIGANLSLQYQKENPEIKASILLSPGLNYRGILGGELAKNLNDNQAIFASGSEHDCGYQDARGLSADKCASDMAKDIFEAAPSKNKQIKIFSNSAHGTTILLRNEGFLKELILWLGKIYV
ncbi:MAG: lysophospholipase [Parcubacteria group bacterium]|nr:lysophospholipase [Parcubacteria group bacterium]MCR4342376.1 lysophospholipase [Patescibacteria group bacterium]